MAAMPAILGHVTPKTKGISTKSHFSEIQETAAILDPIIPKTNRVWPLKLLMTHAKFQDNRTRRFPGSYNRKLIFYTNLYKVDSLQYLTLSNSLKPKQ